MRHPHPGTWARCAGLQHAWSAGCWAALLNLSAVPSKHQSRQPRPHLCHTGTTLLQVGIVAGLLLVTTDRRDIDTQAVVARIRRLLSQRTLAVSRSMRDLSSLARWPGAADD